MKILIVCDRLIPALKYGGTERVIWYLGRELSRLGHTVSYLARAGSRCDFARIIPIGPERPLAGQIPADTDIVHFNDTVYEGISVPHIVTLHGNNNPGLLDLNSVFVSRDHARRYGSVSFVYNGLDWDDYGPADLSSPRRYYHFLGKAAWRIKNVQGAIDVIRALPGARLEVLGGYRFNFKMGMRFTFTPKARFRGMVGGEEKNRLLAGSRGLIFPVKWNEPFGLAITESLYFGAPVFGTPYGSLPELVTPDVGFLSASRREMIAHLTDDPGYSPRLCHEYARDLFNSRAMAAKYLSLYEKVLNGETLNATHPVAEEDPAPTPWHK